MRSGCGMSVDREDKGNSGQGPVDSEQGTAMSVFCKISSETVEGVSAGL